MRVGKLIFDVSGMAEGASARSQYQRLEALLNAYFPGEGITAAAIGKWVERRSVPGAWLMRLPEVARAEGREIDITAYA